MAPRFIVLGLYHGAAIGVDRHRWGCAEGCASQGQCGASGSGGKGAKSLGEGRKMAKGQLPMTEVNFTNDLRLLSPWSKHLEEHRYWL